VLAIVLLIFIIFSFLLKNKIKASFITTTGIVLFFSYGIIHNFLDGFTSGSFYVRHTYLIVIFLILWGVSIFFFSRTKRRLQRISLVTNLFAISLIIIFIINFSLTSIEPQDLTNDENYPDIYYIILDSYAHQTVLMEVYNFDNQEFISFLKEKNFFIPSTSYSNYRHSFLSLNSALNMEYINYLSDELDSNSRNYHKLYEMVDENKVMQILKSKGYKIINFASNNGVTGNIEVADINLCEKNPFIDSQFLIMLIRASILGPVYSEIFDSFSNERTYCVFLEMQILHKKIDKPFFVFAHILLPHSPYRIGPNGENVEYPTVGTKLSESDHLEGYINQVKFVNKKVKETVEKILEENSHAVIIVQSDTGTSLYDPQNQTEIIKRKMMILNAYYFPENGTENLYDYITPVNTFRLIFNLYLDEEYPLLEDKMYYSGGNTELNFTDVTKFELEKLR